MAHLEGIRILNYRSLREVSLGKTYEDRTSDRLQRMIAVIGPNGAGKSSLMDVFGFIGDCLRDGVEAACDAPHRGGFERLRTRGETGPIRFEIYYKEELRSLPISYTLEVDVDHRGLPFVSYERLRQRRKGQSGTGRPYSFAEFRRGKGYAWAGQSTATEEGNEKVEVALEDPQRLAIVTLGNLAAHERIVAFREFLEGWYLSYFIPDLARGLPMSGAQKHLNRRGDNLANYLQYLERQLGHRLNPLLESLAKKVPGVQSVRAERQADGRLLLHFGERGYVDPFYPQDMSDGTLKLLAYLLLLADPEPAPLVGIEEPENGLHHQLLEGLAREMKGHAEAKGGPQVLVTTHSTYFVDALTPEEVWILAKDSDGFTRATRAADVPTVSELAYEGIPLGSLWYSEHFGRLAA
jgi:predicted ATPase